ncbi:hypothetical protein Acr_23g0018630 [Actinidia rufa]|uniref:Uncharacterized protein n=1 Tax=Actinidia rufa TaxID=165716 RepID=A0A7J0GRT8_9ERIC|nr:hypothetical protein Acr_23g0018630 [Actinidia rufa]
MEDSDVQQAEANQSSPTTTIANDQNNDSGQEKANEIPLKNPKLKITIKSPRIPPGYNVQNPTIVKVTENGKTMEDSDVQQEEEKEKAKEEANQSSSTPTIATDQNNSGQEKANEIPLKNPKFKITIKSTRIPLGYNVQNPTIVSAPEGSTKPQQLHLTVPQIKEWNMPVIRYDDEKAFMFTRLWPQFVKFHDLKALDKIRFYTPVPRLHALHYVVAFARREGNLAQIPELRRGKFLFQLELSPSDVGYNRLFIQNEDVTLHFPWIYMAPQVRKTDIIKFTDAQNKDWYMEIMRYDLQILHDYRRLG